MALPATDDFNRADALDLGANWTNSTSYDAGAKIRIVSNTASVSGSARGPSAYWNADSFTADHYSQCVLGTAPDVGPAVRIATNQSYVISGSNHTLSKVTNGTSFSTLQTLPSMAVGDTIKLTVEGSTLKVYKNGSQTGTNQTDATFSTGNPGLWGWTGAMDDWEGGNMGAAGRTTKNTRAFPLGSEIGMGWRL